MPGSMYYQAHWQVISLILMWVYLQEDRSNLLNFRCSGDKYQRINAWATEWLSNEIV